MKQIIDNVPDSVLPEASRTKVLEALENNVPQYSVRLNPSKFAAVPKTLEPVTWCDNAYYLKDKPKFSMDPFWHSGAYYVQEAGSLFLNSVIKHIGLENPIRALDLCAAPGGKSTLLLNTLPKGSVVLANEMNALRSKSLVENAIKWGSSNLLVTNNSSRDFKQLPNYFDLVLVDAPCSGEGLLRRNDEALNQWSTKLIESCAYTQKQILDDALLTLKPGGHLIYCTCTFNVSEDEDNLQWLIEERGCEQVELNVPNNNGIIITKRSGNTSYRFFPGLTRSEGFFITVVRKGEDHYNPVRKTKPEKQNHIKLPSNALFELPDEMFVIESNGVLRTFNDNSFAVYSDWKGKLKFIQAGWPLGAMKGSKFVPDPFLPFSVDVIFNDEHWIQLDYRSAISYLAMQPFELHHQKGYAVVRYENINLGLVNVIENRFNNYFPKEWRLLKPDFNQEFSLKAL